jgi:hypothetical protein
MSPILTKCIFRLLGCSVCAACLALTATTQDKNPSPPAGRPGANQGQEKQTQAASKPEPGSDTGISECINKKIKASSKLKGQSIAVSVTNGEASLIGSVRTESRKRSAVSIAKKCHAKTVNNALTVDSGAKTKGPKAKDIKPQEDEKKTPKP